ncbi:MAG: tRNA (cytidine(56)-2'-O)-methyltransferase [Candidatus Helarchaeota archaeon]|nr:tRNA (cytidine(56)-2'-O)-methyltransferase [Candidatus Helarchaeota archaeon]
MGHRQFRDNRITTHVGLVGRAFGANGMILADISDAAVENSINEINQNWGGNFFIRMGVPHLEFMREWINKGNIIIHLTMYGENLSYSLIDEIKKNQKDILLVVGSQKVPRNIYDLAHYNISISNQPHSEISALSIFLDRYFEGKQFLKKFKGAKFEITPSKKNKIVRSLK